MTERYSVLSHTADTGIEAAGADLAELIGCLAFGMFDLMYDLDALSPGEETALDVPAGAPAELLVDVLSELLYRSETLDVAYRDIGVAVSDTAATVTARACPTAGAALTGPPIKAITYHELLVEQLPDGTWRGRVIFDV